MDVTISLYRACVGGYVGGGYVHPALLDAAREGLAEAKEAGRVSDGFVARCGEDVDLVLMDASDARSVAHDVFGNAASAASRLRQQGTNGGVQFDGIDLTFAPRPNEPVLCFFSNGTRPGAWNLYAYRLLADPFVTTGLVTDPALRTGFRFTTHESDGAAAVFELPDDLYALLGALRSGARITDVCSRASGERAAVVSGGSDAILVVRCSSPFPSVEDALEAFTSQRAVGQCPLVPVSANGDATARSMPRAMGLGFQVTPERLVGPRDLLGDAAFDEARREGVAAASAVRRAAVIRAPDEVSSAI